MTDQASQLGVADPPVAGWRRRMLAEALGTAVLVLFGAGTILAAAATGAGQMSYAALGFIALAFGAAVTLAIFVFGPTSGAHINPAVTIALAVIGRFPWRGVGPYVAAQLAGAAVGAAGIVAVFGADAARAAMTGATTLGSGVGFAGGVAAEALGTFLLVLTVVALAVDSRAPLGWAGPGIGLAVTAEILLIGPVTGGSVNPARTFGPYLVTTLIGGPVPWAEFPVYVIGPVLGGIVAAGVYVAVGRPFLSH
jgi:glycerol uptake facilitator protein